MVDGRIGYKREVKEQKIPLISWIVFAWSSIMLFWNNIFFNSFKLNIFLWTLIGLTLFRLIYLFGIKNQLWTRDGTTYEIVWIMVLLSFVLLILRISGVIPQ